MAPRPPRPFVLLGLLLTLITASWAPAVAGIEAASQHHPSTTATTWQVLHAAFHRYGVSPYPDFIPWQSSAPSPAATLEGADRPHAAAHHQAAAAAAAATAAGHSSRMQCSAAGTCAQVEAGAAAAASQPAASDTGAGLQQPTSQAEPGPAAHQAAPSAGLIAPAAGDSAAAAMPGTPPHHAAAAVAAPSPAGEAAQLLPIAAAGVQDAMQPHASPTPAPPAAAATPAGQAPARLHRPPPVRRLLNLAELSDGASVLAANPEARRPERAIDRDIDSFMKNDCDAEKWMIIELSQLGTVETVKLTMKELYSSRVHTFRVLGRSSHPRKDGPDFTANLASGAWQLLGSFTAENKRGMQSFSLPQRSRVRYLLLMFDTHYGNEQMCAMNWIEVLGVSAAQELEEALALQELEAEHEEHPHAHVHDSHHLQHHQQQHQQALRHPQQQQLPAAPPHPVHQQQQQQQQQAHHPSPKHPSPVQDHTTQQQQQSPHVQAAGAEQQQRTPTHQREQPQQQEAQAGPSATQAHSPDGAGLADSPAAADAMHEHATATGATAAAAGTHGVLSSQQQAAASREHAPADQVVPEGSQPGMLASKQRVPERPGDTPADASRDGIAAVPAAAVKQPPDSQQQGQQPPHAPQGDLPRSQGQPGSPGSPVEPQAQLPTPAGRSPTGAGPAAPTPSDGPAAGSGGQGVVQSRPSVEPAQQQADTGQQQQPQQKQPPAAKEAPPPGAASPAAEQQQHQEAGSGGQDRPSSVPAAAELLPVALAAAGAGQAAGTAGATAPAAATQQQQLPHSQTGPTGSRGGSEPPPQQQQQQPPPPQQQPPSQPVPAGQTGISNGNGAPPVRAADTGSVLDSRGSNKPKQAGNLFDVVKSEMMQLKLDQGKLTKKVDSLTKRSGDFEATAAALQQQQAALSHQLERLSKKLDALIGTQAAAAAAQQQLRKDVGTLLAAHKERQGRGYPHGGQATGGRGAPGYGVGPDTVLPDLHAGQPGGIVDASGRPLLPPVCARVGEEPPLLLQARYQWSVVTALAGTSLLGLWLVLHPKSLGMPQVLRLVVCVLALLNGILAVLLGLWLVVMQGIASQAQVLLTPDPRLSVPVYRMLGNGSAWGDAPH